MGIEVTSDSLRRTLERFEKVEKVVDTATVDALRSVGEYMVTEIRQGRLSDWNNRSGSLRSSIGCAVGHNGQVIYISDFEIILQGADGARKGKALAESLVSDNSSYDYTLVIVAGEEYAVYVEAVENRIVLSSGWLYLKSELSKILRDKVQQALRKV